MDGVSGWGQSFIGLITAFLDTHERRTFAPLTGFTPSLPKPPKPAVNPTAQVTLELYRAGKSIAEIAAERGLVESTIEGHLATAIAQGESIDPRSFYTESEEQEIRAALEGYTEESLKPVFEHLGGRISYGKLKLFRAFESRASPSDEVKHLAR